MDPARLPQPHPTRETTKEEISIPIWLGEHGHEEATAKWLVEHDDLFSSMDNNTTTHLPDAFAQQEINDNNSHKSKNNSGFEDIIMSSAEQNEIIDELREHSDAQLEVEMNGMTASSISTSKRRKFSGELMMAPSSPAASSMTVMMEEMESVADMEVGMEEISSTTATRSTSINGMEIIEMEQYSPPTRISTIWEVASSIEELEQEEAEVPRPFHLYETFVPGEWPECANSRMKVVEGEDAKKEREGREEREASWQSQWEVSPWSVCSSAASSSSGAGERNKHGRFIPVLPLYSVRIANVEYPEELPKSPIPLPLPTPLPPPATASNSQNNNPPEQKQKHPQSPIITKIEHLQCLLLNKVQMRKEYTELFQGPISNAEFLTQLAILDDHWLALAAPPAPRHPTDHSTNKSHILKWYEAWIAEHPDEEVVIDPEDYATTSEDDLCNAIFLEIQDRYLEFEEQVNEKIALAFQIFGESNAAFSSPSLTSPSGIDTRLWKVATQIQRSLKGKYRSEEGKMDLEYLVFDDVWEPGAEALKDFVGELVWYFGVTREYLEERYKKWVLCEVRGLVDWGLLGRGEVLEGLLEGEWTVWSGYGREI